jgi:MFS family permease
VLPDREAISFASMLRIPPAALAGAIVAGVANTGVTTQLPLYAKDLAPGQAGASAASLYIAAMIGGTITQWPAGLISDRIDRRFVVAALAAIAFIACIALYLTAGRVSFAVTVMLAALWGAGALSFYSISASHATDRAEPGQIASVMSGMLFVWAAGSVAGPIITGTTADTQLGQPGVFAVVAVLYFALLAANLWRVSVMKRPDALHRSPFVAVAGTSVVEGQVADAASPSLASAQAPGKASDQPA